MRTTALLAAVALFSALSVSASPHLAAQSVTGKIKRAAKQRIQDQKQKTEQQVVNEAVEPVDSTLAKGTRPIEGAVARTAAHADSAVSRASRAVAASVKGEPREVRRIAAALGEGRFVLDRVVFGGSTETLDPASDEQLAALADVLTRTAGTYLLQAHVALPGDGKASQQLAARRAAAVRDWLVAAGIEPSRLFVAGSADAPDRVEIVGMN